MLKSLWIKLREALVSVFPVAAIVCVLFATPLLTLSSAELAVFLVSAAFLVLGIGLFNLGADLSMTPMGEHVGSGLSKSRKTGLLLLVCFVLGVFITVAEPDLSVLAAQVGEINSVALIATVGVGVGIFLVIAVLKIIFKRELSALLMAFYMLLFALAALLTVRGADGYLSMSFDSGGVTTGPVTVPFIMALGVGIATTIGGRNAGENSFGLVSLCSVGPILAVMALLLVENPALPAAISGEQYAMPENPLAALPGTLLEVAKEVAISLGLIVVFFFVIQFIFLHLPKKKLRQMAVGIAYTYVGLVVFLTAVNFGFLPVGYRMGQELAQNAPSPLLVGFAFLLGLVVVLAEPAVHVLNKQVEEITDGTVTKRSMMIALSVGVGISIALSVLRIQLHFSVLYYLVPGYFLSLGLSFFVPPMYTAIAFDSGGVASGPLTSSFILPFAIGACTVLQGAEAVMQDAFGIVAMVAMTPLITIQLLGFRAIASQKLREKVAMRRILDKDDEQIISFM